MEVAAADIVTTDSDAVYQYRARFIEFMSIKAIEFLRLLSRRKSRW